MAVPHRHSHKQTVRIAECHSFECRAMAARKYSGKNQDFERYQTLPNATLIASPFTPLDSCDARNAIVSATSSAVTTRPAG